MPSISESLSSFRAYRPKMGIQATWEPLLSMPATAYPPLRTQQHNHSRQRPRPTATTTVRLHLHHEQNCVEPLIEPLNDLHLLRKNHKRGCYQVHYPTLAAKVPHPWTRHPLSQTTYRLIRSSETRQPQAVEDWIVHVRRIWTLSGC